MVCIESESTSEFAFPTPKMICGWPLGVLHTLAGFENEQDGEGFGFNFILSNGLRSNQKDNDFQTDYTFMMPEGSEIRSVTIWYWSSVVAAFQFFDKNNTCILEIGAFEEAKDYVTVVLEEHEVIIGVVAKLLTGYQ